METDLDQLMALVARKNLIDQTSAASPSKWSAGSRTYLAELVKEVAEVEDAIAQDSLVHIEDELGDVLWDYLNLISSLSGEKGVSWESVLKRAVRKYEERISGIEGGQLWKDIKVKQKARLQEEALHSNASQQK